MDLTHMISHYEVLGLPSDPAATQDLSAPIIKAAYRRALLRNHPDKARTQTAYPNDENDVIAKKRLCIYSVDRISEAYAVLSAPKLRAEYDRALRLRSMNNNGQGEQQGFRTGIETVDLDDLSFEEAGNLWYRGCRCGDERGFLVREEDLEDAADDGELNVGCKGCSLWLRVLFGVLEDEPLLEDEMPTKGNG